MAQKIVKDSHLAIFVQSVNVASTVVGSDWVEKGAIRGLAGYSATLAEDGLYYTTVDTAAEVRFDGASGTVFAIGDPVYRTTADGVLTKTLGAGKVLIGFATRAKATGAGKLFVQLVPQAV